MSWKHEHWLSLDCETTGFSPSKGARIVEVAAMTFHEGEVVAGWHHIVNPECDVPEDVTKIHGITTAMAYREPTLIDRSGELLDRLSKSPVLIAYNWPFDSRFLGAELDEHWEYGIAGKLIIDPLVVVRLDTVGRYWKGSGRHKLGAVADRLGIPVHADALHRAAGDAVLAGRVLHKLLDYLPDDEDECARLLGRERTAQDENHKAWRATQPARNGESQ